MNDLKIGGLTDVEIVERRVGERLHPAVLRQLDRRQIVFERGNLLARHILPHLKEQRSHVRRAITAQQDAGILPVAEAHLFVDVFIGKVDAAHIPHIAVYDHHFAVISIVQIGIERRNKAVETDRANAERYEIAVIVLRQRRDRPDIIVNDADIQAFLCLSRQNIENRVPHLAFFNDEVFEKDEPLRRF